MGQKKKGQINVYFLISSAIFISMTIYLIYLLVNFYPERGDSIRINSLYGKAYIISELMLKDQGLPPDWNDTDLRRIGLADLPYKLNQSKIKEMQKMCSSTDNSTIRKLSSSLGLVDETVAINIDYLNGTRAMDCNPFRRNFENYYEGSRFVKMTRIATINGEIVEVTVYVG